MIKIIVANKVCLRPNKEQEKILLNYCNVSRFIYNWSLALKIRMYEDYNLSYGQKEIMQELKEIKHTAEYEWLQDVNSETLKQSVKDMLSAYKAFYNRGNKGFPKFKRKSCTKLSHYQRYDRVKLVDKRHVKLTGIILPVKTTEDIDFNKILNPRVSFDGKYWYLAYSYEFIPPREVLTDEVVGIDLGIKELAITSAEVHYQNINKTRRVKLLKSRLKRLQRRLSVKYEKNKQGNKYIKTSNIKRLEREIKLIYRQLKNIRETYIHQVTYSVVKTKPRAIVIEDLNVSGMMKNKHLAKAIQEQLFYTTRQFLSYKCKLYGGIKLIVAPRQFPSSKLCSYCGNKKKFLSLSERVYKCDHCGQIINRDYNASLNLRNYGLNILSST